MVDGILAGERFVAFTAHGERERTAALDTALAKLRDHRVSIIEVGRSGRGSVSVPDLLRDLSCRGSECASGGNLKLAGERLTELRGDESRVLLVVAAAERLDTAALSFVQLLTSLFVDDEPTLQVLFVGAPAFHERIGESHLRDFRERIAIFDADQAVGMIDAAWILWDYLSIGKLEIQKSKANGRAAIERYRAVLAAINGRVFLLRRGALLGSAFGLTLVACFVIALPFHGITRPENATFADAARQAQTSAPAVLALNEAAAVPQMAPERTGTFNGNVRSHRSRSQASASVQTASAAIRGAYQEVRKRFARVAPERHPAGSFQGSRSSRELDAFIQELRTRQSRTTTTP